MAVLTLLYRGASTAALATMFVVVVGVDTKIATAKSQTFVAADAFGTDVITVTGVFAGAAILVVRGDINAGRTAALLSLRTGFSTGPAVIGVVFERNALLALSAITTTKAIFGRTTGSSTNRSIGGAVQSTSAIKTFLACITDVSTSPAIVAV